MAFFFNNIEGVKEFIGGGANISMAIESLSPVMEMAAEEHLLQWIGRDQFNDIREAYDTSDMTDQQAALLPYIQRPLAMLGLHEYSKVGGIMFDESGIHRTENEYQKSAYKYQENEYRNWMLNNGYTAIELMLNFLEANEDDYPIWQASTAYTKNKSLFINTSEAFRDYYSKSISRYTFEMLRPVMEDVEIFAIHSTLGDDQYEELKTAITEKTETTQQTALIRVISKAVAYFTIEEALKRHWVQLEGNKIVQKEVLGDQGYIKEGIPSQDKISLSIRHNDEFANRHISYIKKFLADNLADYPTYSAYLDELAAAAAAAEAIIVGEDCCERDECDNYLTRTTRTGVIRL
ncbi:MAG TPA: hypothetical protein PK643_00360 [Saprospiraceae bacterium]|nr:hypothetical protein [Saprospiraceae bacterium]